jgi:hypothetical protein
MGGVTGPLPLGRGGGRQGGSKTQFDREKGF